MTVVLDMLHWSRSFEGRRSPLVAQALLRPRGYECEKVDYLRLLNEVEIL